MTPPMKPQQMSPLERLEELELAVVDLKNQLNLKEQVIAHAVLLTLKEEVILEEVIKRTVAAVESEWSGKFLPELRRTIKADVMEALRTGSL